MSNFEITGGKIKDLFCHYNYREEISEGIYNTATIKSELPTHEDLRNAFDTLKPHLPFLLDYKVMQEDNLEVRESAETVPPSNFLEIPEDLDPFVINSLFYDHENDSVTISGKRVLKIGLLPIETPSISLNGSYVFKKALRNCVNLILTEIESYHNGKRAFFLEQMDLFPDAVVVEKENLQLENGSDGVEETPEQLEERIKREIEEGKRNKDGSIKKKGRGRKKKEATDDELNAIDD